MGKELTAEVVLQVEAKGFPQHQGEAIALFLPLRAGRGRHGGGVGQVGAAAHHQAAVTAHLPVLRGQVMQEQESPL